MKGLCLLLCPGGIWLKLLLASTLGLAQSFSAASVEAAERNESGYANTLDVTVPTKEIVLGEVDRVGVLIKTPSDSVPVLSTSVGRISVARRVSEGHFRASLELPKTKFPQYAIIAAVDGQKNYGWRAVPLMARALIEVDSEPQVNVSVRLRRAEFGPRLTDKRGLASIEVLVPPGLKHAVSAAKDSLGNTSLRRVPLGAPPINRLLLVCPADEEHVLAFAVKQDGVGETRAGFEVESQQISIGEPRSIRQGAFLIPFEVHEGVKAGDRATVELKAQHSRSTCQLEVPLEEPSAVSMTADTSVMNADEPSEITLRVLWTFPGLRSPRRVNPRFEATIGSTSVERLSNHEQLVRWRIPSFFEGHTKASFAVTYDGRNSRRASHTVELKPGKLVGIKMFAGDGPLLANGKTSTRVRLIPADAHGNRRVLENPKVSPSARMSPLKRQPDGSYLATYRTTESYSAVKDRIEVTDASGIRGSVDISLTPRQQGFWGVARLGYVDNLGQIHALSGMAGVGLRLPVGDENVVVGLDAGVFHSSQTQVADGDDIDIKLTGIPVLARVGYEIPMEALLTGLRVYPAFVGGGLWAGASAKGPTIDQFRATVVPMIGGLVGANIPAGPGRPSLELGLYRAELNSEWVRGSAVRFQGMIGYAFSP